MVEQDITKTGPVGLKGLNRQQKEDNPLDHIDYRQVAERAFRGTSDIEFDPAQYIPQHRDPNDPMADWGNSKYDDLSPYVQGEDLLNEHRFENQSTVDAMGNALAKMLSTAGTTIVSGLGNLIYGPATAISEGRWSGLWDNDLTRALSEIDNFMEDNFKIYQSKEQQNAPWLSVANLTSASFWGDGVIKNAGFMLGAAASGSMFTGGLGLASRALGLASKASKAGKITTALLGSMFSAAGEGAIEAKNTAESIIQLETQRLDDALSQEYQKAVDEYNSTKGTLRRGSDGQLYDPAAVKLEQVAQDIKRRREAGVAQIQQDARSAGNWDMALNIPILTLSNFITLGKGFSKSFANARKMAEASNKADASGLIGRYNTAKNNLKNIYKKARSGELVDDVSYELKNIKGRKAWEAVKPIISEGSEEMNQQWASSFSGYYKAHREDPNDYWKARLDPGSQQESASAITAIAKGFYDSWGDFDQWEQFFVGGLTGAIGMPMPSKVFNQNKDKKWYNPNRYFSWEGGVFQNLKDLNNKLNEATQLNEALNKRVKDSSFWNRLASMSSHAYHQATMDEAVANDDIKTFKDAEEKQFVQDLDAFVRAGKVDDFRTFVSAATQDLSNEDIDNLLNRNTITITKEQDEQNYRNNIDRKIAELNATLTASKSEEESRNILAQILQLQAEKDNYVGEEKKIGLYTDSHGNLTKSYDEIRQELQENGKKINDRIDSYLESINKVNRLSQGRLDSDKEGNLAYLDYMSKAARKRAENIVDRVILPKSISIRPIKDEDLSMYQKLYGLNEEDIAQNDNGTVSINISSLDNDTKRAAFLDLGIGHDSESAKDNIMSTSSVPSVINNLIDATKLLLDSREFTRTFNEYMAEPSKVDEAKAKAEKEADKEIKNSTLDNKPVSEIVKDAKEGKIDLEDDIFDSDEFDDGEALNEAQTLAKERQGKVNTAKDIISTENSAKQKIKEKAKDDTAAADANVLLDSSVEKAETLEELLDVDRESFNDPNALPNTEQDQSLLEIFNNPNTSPEEAVKARKEYEESRQRRLDEAKNIINEIREEIESERHDAKDMPSSKEGTKTPNTAPDNKSKDPTEATPTVNKKTDESIEEEYPQTPDTRNENLNSPTIEEETISKDYWKNNTTEYPIHRGDDSNKPYYEQVNDSKKRAFYEAVFNFLQKKGAFTRLKNNEVKANQKIKFAISKTLTSDIKRATGDDVPVVLILDENNNIIGDLVSFYDSIANQYQGLKEFYDTASKYYIDHSSEVEGDLVVIPNMESTISRIYVGRPLYSKENHTLNEISEGRPFKLGLALTTSTNPNIIMTPNRRRSQGPSSDDMKIMLPREAKAGQPFLLIETSDPRRKYYPVRILMPTFDFNDQYSLTNLVVSHLLRLASELELEKLSDERKQIEWKDKLKDLLSIGDIYLNITPIKGTKKYNVVFRIKKLSTDTEWHTIYTGSDVNEMTNVIATNMTALGLPYQISRKYINGQLGNSNYNSLIGELANTNIAIGALHTVNDFFSINPIIKGNQTKAGTIKDAKSVVKEAVQKKDEEAQSEPTKGEISIEELKNSIKTKGKRNFKGVWPEIIDKVNKENLEALNNLATPILNRKLEFIKPKLSKTMSEDEVNKTISDMMKRNREVTSQDTNSNTLNKELKVLEKLLPQLSQEDRVRVLDSLIKTFNGNAWGQLKDGIISIYKSAARGTAYHEAFHFVFNNLMSDSEIERAYKIAKKQWGTLNPIELEERMAEGFRRYMQNEETFIGRFRNLWSKLKALINHFNSNWFYLDRVYADIVKGNYSSRKVRNTTTTRNMETPTIEKMQRIVDSQVNSTWFGPTRKDRNNAWGNLVDKWRKWGFILKGYHSTKYRGYVVTSITPIDNSDQTVKQYHYYKLAYNRLTQEQKNYLNEKGISPSEYMNMTPQEREVLFRCMY